MIQRRITSQIEKDLSKKMVTLAGPRQCGKTTLSRDLLKIYSGNYMGWDDKATRLQIQKGDLDWDSQLWVFDELHKYKKWRNFLKGLYDVHHEGHKILVTGSAQLEAFSRGGDSLQGRYYSHRLHPFTFSEVQHLPEVHFEEAVQLPLNSPAGSDRILEDLMTLGGFPEPFLSGSLKESNRWRLAYGTRLTREEVSSLEGIKDLDSLELMFEQLNQIAGSTLSINSLREDLEVAFETVRNWLRVLERFYAIFRVSPFGPAKLKAVKKEQKLYFWDWAKCATEGARYENLIALHLLRWTHWIEDVEGEKIDLRFFKSREGHEVDFVLLRNNKPWIAIEAKLSDSNLAPSLSYFLERVKTPYAFQVFLKNGQAKRWPDINGCQVRSISASHFLSQLP